MDLPITDVELKEIVCSLNPQSELYDKLHTIMLIREKQHRLDDVKETAERFGFVI